MTAPKPRPALGAATQRGVLAAFAGIVVLGGFNFYAVSVSNDNLPPFWGASVRFGAAGLLFLGLVAWRRAPLPRGRALLGAALYGALAFGAGYAFAYYSLVGIGPGLASVVMALVPMLTLLFATAQGVESFRVAGLAGAALAVAGIALVSFEGIAASGSPLFVGVAFLAAVSAAQSGIVVKRFPRADPAATNAVGMLTGTAILLVASLVAGEPWSLPAGPSGWVAVAYLALPGSLGLFALYLFVLSHWTASATSYLFVLTPIVAIPLGALAAGEPVTVVFLGGAALVLLGVWVGALRRTPAPAAARLAEAPAPRQRP